MKVEIIGAVAATMLFGSAAFAASGSPASNNAAAPQPQTNMSSPTEGGSMRNPGGRTDGGATTMQHPTMPGAAGSGTTSSGSTGATAPTGTNEGSGATRSKDSGR